MLSNVSCAFPGVLFVGMLLFLYYRWGNWDSEDLSNLYKDMTRKWKTWDLKSGNADIHTLNHIIPSTSDASLSLLGACWVHARNSPQNGVSVGLIKGKGSGMFLNSKIKLYRSGFKMKNWNVYLCLRFTLFMQVRIAQPQHCRALLIAGAVLQTPCSQPWQPEMSPGAVNVPEWGQAQSFPENHWSNWKFIVDLYPYFWLVAAESFPVVLGSPP